MVVHRSNGASRKKSGQANGAVRKAIVYLRFSPRPERQVELSESLETQLELCQRYAAKNNLEIVGTFADEDTSGAVGEPGDEAKRQGLWDALAAMRRGYVLLAWRPDRLARNAYLSEYIRRSVATIGGTIATVSAGEESNDPDSVLLRRILAAVDDHFRVIGNIRTSYYMLRHQRSHRAMSKDLPYGFREGAEKVITLSTGEVVRQRQMEPDPNEQAVLNRIIQMHAEGVTAYAIAKMLNDEGVPSRGRRWWVRSIDRITQREY